MGDNANVGLTQRKGADRRRKQAVVEMETGAVGESRWLPGMTREYSGWDVYNNEAKKVDMELVNDWRESLNSLLLFVGILPYSLVLAYSHIYPGRHLCRCPYGIRY
jgi:hypothetical protein